MKNLILMLLLALTMAGCSDSENNEEKINNLYSNGMFNIDKLQSFLDNNPEELKEAFKEQYQISEYMTGFSVDIDNFTLSFFSMNQEKTISSLNIAYSYSSYYSNDEVINTFNGYVKEFCNRRGNGYDIDNYKYLPYEDLMLSSPKEKNYSWIVQNNHIQYFVSSWINDNNKFIPSIKLYSYKNTD